MNKIYEATIEEKGIWLKNESYSVEERSTLIEAAALKISGSIEYNDIEKAIYFFIKQTPIVRAGFKLDNDKIIKVIHNNLTKKSLSFYDFTKSSTEETLEDKLNEVLQKPMDISKEIITFSLCKYEKNSYILLLPTHHVMGDHVTALKMLSSIMSYYEDIIINHTKDVDLVDYELEYESYMIDRDKKILENTEAEKYWKNKFKTQNEFSFLQPDYAYPKNGSLNSGLIIDKIFESKNVKQYARKNRVTPYIVLLSVLNLLITKIDKDNLSCATSIAFSTRDKITKDQVGCFINALPLIIHSDMDTKFSDFLKKVRDEMKQLSKYKQYPFFKVNNFFPNVRDLPYHPLQRITTTYTVYKPFSTKVNHVELSSFPIRTIGTDGADLSIVFADNGLDISMEINYNKDIFKKETIVHFSKLFNMLLEEILDDSHFEKKLKEYTLLTKQEEQELLIEYNDTKVAYPKEKTIHQLFEDQVKLNPENIAVVYEDEKLTYKQLNTKSNQLAHYLIEQGVIPDSLVAICVDRSLEMMIGLLAILKAGGAYVPIDATYPADRIKHMLEDSKAKILLTQEPIKDTLPKTKSQIITIDTLDTSKEKTTNPKTKVTSSNLAYVIYTSGSTGLPKGVIVEHTKVVNLIQWHIDKFNVTSISSATQIASIAFDAAVWEIWPYFAKSAKLILITKEKMLDIEKLHNYLYEEKVTHSFIPSAISKKFLQPKTSYCARLEYIFLGGEKLSSYENKEKFIVINNYGVTESTVVSTSCIINEKNQIPPIGRPINNTQLYILDKYLNPVPKGVAGELHIAGDGLARGYLNQPALTKEKFIDNPFTKGTRLYKTGDLVRYLEDGNIEYIRKNR